MGRLYCAKLLVQSKLGYPPEKYSSGFEKKAKIQDRKGKRRNYLRQKYDKFTPLI